MAQSIKLGSDTYLDASGVTMDSFGRTLKESLPTMRQYSDLIAHNASKTYAMSAGASGILFTASGYTDLRSAYIFRAESNGNVRTSALLTASGVAISTSANGLTITNNSENNTIVPVFFIVTVGTVTIP